MPEYAAQFHQVNSTPLHLKTGHEIRIEEILEAVHDVNKKFFQLAESTEKIAFNVFEVIDFRMMSGLVGESLVSEISHKKIGLKGNPNIDGYPDLTDISKPEYEKDFDAWKSTDITKFIKYAYGGIEVKNTFGTKRGNVTLNPGDKRISSIGNKLDWKAHHRYTNNLLGCLSDFVDGRPQIVAVMYTDALTEDDWADKQNPKEGSTMTSFSVIKSSGWDKMKKGLLFVLDEAPYLDYFGVTNE